MADTERENALGFVDKRATQASNTRPGNNAVDARYLTVGNLRTALNARSATTYPTAVLDTMTKNDMVFALRSFDDASGI